MKEGFKRKRRWAALPVMLAVLIGAFAGNDGNFQKGNVISSVRAASDRLPAEETGTTAAHTDQDDQDGEGGTQPAETDSADQEKVKLAQPENVNFQGYDVIYVIDNSKSVWTQQEIRNQAFRNISNMAIGSDIRVGVLYFADHLYDHYTLSLTPMETEEDSRDVLQALRMKEQDTSNIDTNIGGALEKAVSMFDSQDASRKRIIILFSDGINENLAGDSDYAQNADEKTREQAAVLREMDIPIYCVYLEKSRNDEAYLRSLVNYFSGELSFDQERFYKVAESEINLLLDRFVDVFFAMQNNMKFRRLEPDSAGKIRFYVPALGVRNLRICVDGEIQESVRLTAPSSGEFDDWQDGDSVFINYDMPPAGDWTIDLSSSDPEKVHGTIACYAYLQASAELAMAEESENKSDKAQVYQLTVRFFDEGGNEIKIDPAAAVSASVILSKEDSSGEPVELKMSVEDGAAKSEPFQMTFYGDFYYRVNLAEDFVNLNYTLEGGTIEKNAPVPSDLKGKWFFGEQTEEGLRFSIREDRLYQDPEDESVKIQKTVQLNDGNPVEAELRDGYVYVTAQKQGRVSFTLQLSDSSGMEAEVAVEGTLVSRTLLSRIGIALIAGICLGVLFFVAEIYRKKKKEEKLEGQFARFKRIREDFDKAAARCLEENKQLWEYQEDVEFALSGDGDVKGLTELTIDLPEEMREEFLHSEQPEVFYANLLADIREYEDLISGAKERMSACADAVERIKKEQDSMEQADKEMERKLEEASVLLEEMRDICKNEETQNKAADEKIAEFGRIAGAVERMLKTDIVCNLTVTVEGEASVILGRKSCMDNRGRFLQGFYRFDDIRTLENGKLGQNIGETGILIYGYHDEAGEAGLRLKSSRPFTWRPLKGTIEETEAAEAVLKKNQEYELRLAVKDRTVCIRLTVD